MKAHPIHAPMFVIVLVTPLLFTVGSKSYAADPHGVSAPSGKHWVVTFEDDFTKDKEIERPPNTMDRAARRRGWSRWARSDDEAYWKGNTARRSDADPSAPDASIARELPRPMHDDLPIIIRRIDDLDPARLHDEKIQSSCPILICQ